MVPLNLEDLELYKALVSRGKKDSIAQAFSGLLLIMGGDAARILEFIKTTFPLHTDHDIQHSWRIVRYIGDILSKKAKLNLTPIELFAFITAAAFHDAGMTDIDSSDLTQTRENHHKLANDFIIKYLGEQVGLISDYPRLAKCIAFIAESHGMSWDEMLSHPTFKHHEKIAGQLLRSNLLALLLRVGDLMDFEERSNCFVRKHLLAKSLDKTGKMHHKLQEHIAHYNYDPNSISIIVESHSREEHEHWNGWFKYLEQDINRANTNVFIADLDLFALPSLNSKINKAAGAKYDVWPLRFEVDKQGRIWDVISQTIYTGRFDFIREIVQNAIDAALIWIFANNDAKLPATSPRSWQLTDYEPAILIFYSKKNKMLVVIDNGIGMDRDALKHFLFMVAESGFNKIKTKRAIKFPSIAKFGLGFTSVLVRANTVIIQSKRRPLLPEDKAIGIKVVLETGCQEAYTEDTDCDFGTNIKLFLNDDFEADEIMDYVQKHIVYPSIPIHLLNADILLETIMEAKHNGSSLPEGLEHINNVEDIIRETGANSSKLTLLAKRIKEISRSNPETDIYFTISNKNFLDEFPAKLYFIRINHDFEIEEVVREVKELRMDECAIILIPVSFISHENGIEWKSLHGFLVHNSEIQKEIHQYVPDHSVDKSFILGNEEADRGDYYDLEDEGIILTVADQIERRINEYDNGRASKSDISEYDLLKIRKDDIIRETSDGIREYERSFIELDLMDNPYVDDSEIKELSDWLTQLDNNIFQDGIKLNIPASSIAPIGLCKARLNLTASSRFELNVSRNTINESPTLLNAWVSNVGTQIQSAVIDHVTGLFKKEGYSFNLLRLLPDTDEKRQDAALLKVSQSHLKDNLKKDWKNRCEA